MEPLSPSAHPLLCCQPFDSSCCEGFVAAPRVPAAGRQHCVGWDRGRWRGTGATCGYFGTAGGYLVSPTAGLRHGDVTARGMHWDGPELAPALGCYPQSQAHPRVLQGFWGQWKIQSQFFGELDQRESYGEALQRVRVPKDTDVVPDHGKLGWSFQILSCYRVLCVSHLYSKWVNNLT